MPCKIAISLSLKRTRRASYWLLAMIFVAINCGLPALSSDSKVLKGHVQIDEVLGALPSEYQPGKVFDWTNRPIDNSYWYRIPPWFSGQWKNDVVEAIEWTNLQTGDRRQRTRRVENPQFVYFGTVRDKTGDLWERAPLNRWSVTKYEGRDSFFQSFTSAEVQIPDKDHLLVKSEWLSLSIDPESKRIKSASRGQTLHTYSTKGASVMNERTVARSFDETGKAQSDRTGSRDLERVAEIDFDSSEYQSSLHAFSEYAQSHGLADVIPER